MSEEITLFAKQRTIHPRKVDGRYRRLKWLAMVVLLGIYYLAPWLRWDRGPHAPDQAILIDMPARKAYFFFIEIWPQEVYYLTGILILAAVMLFFVTSMFGRVWCGYACPQTVWTDLFRLVEEKIQGDRNARIKLDQAPLTLNKIFKKLTTHLLWLLIGLLTGGAWVFYFNDAPTLLDHIVHFDVSWAVGGWIIALTLSTYLMAGFAREQVCTYMCPYARFQSGMFDKDTLIISYEAERGEPRGKHKKGDSWEGHGHCVDCDSCVVVCPMGIDIRKGLQYECIACGLCVDACNHVMDTVGLPRGLIRYDTSHNMSARTASTKAHVPFHERLRLLRPRTLYYASIMSVVGGVMLYGLLTRGSLDLNVLHDRNPLFVNLSDGRVRNAYAVKIINKSYDDQSYQVAVEGLESPEIKLEGAGVLDPENLKVFADSVGEFRVMLSAEPVAGNERRDIKFRVIENGTGKEIESDSVFVTGQP